MGIAIVIFLGTFMIVGLVMLGTLITENGFTGTAEDFMAAVDMFRERKKRKKEQKKEG